MYSFVAIYKQFIATTNTYNFMKFISCFDC